MADAVIDATARVPWWVGVGLALVAYLVLHRIAEQPLAVVVKPGQIGTMVQGMLVHTFASIGQYLLPFLLLLGALVSVLRRRKAGRLHADAAGGAAAISAMAWPEFEVLVGEYFRRRGFAVTERSRGDADGGVDIELSKDGDRYLVQCKQWRARKVPVETVRELYGVMTARRVSGGFVVTSGRFMQPAMDFAAGREIELIDGQALGRALQAQQRVRAATPPAAGVEPRGNPTAPPRQPVAATVSDHRPIPDVAQPL